MEEDYRLCRDLCECITYPPSLDWQVVPLNLRQILAEKKVYRKKEVDPFEPTDLSSFMEDPATEEIRI